MLTNSVCDDFISCLHLQYSEMLDLEGLKSMELDFPNQKKVMPVYTLKLRTEVVQLKVMADYFFFLFVFMFASLWGYDKSQHVCSLFLRWTTLTQERIGGVSS